MARPTTVTRVHAAALEVAGRGDPAALTMEGIAAAAGVGKQTLYRTWPSVPAILFDALAAEPGRPREPPSDHAEARVALEDALLAAIDEIWGEPRNTLLRTLAAAIQSDADVAEAYRRRLLDPQLEQMRVLVGATGADEPARATELLLAPIFYRWFMRLPPPERVDLRRMVHDVLERDSAESGDAASIAAWNPGP